MRSLMLWSSLWVSGLEKKSLHCLRFRVEVFEAQCFEDCRFDGRLGSGVFCLGMLGWGLATPSMDVHNRSSSLVSVALGFGFVVASSGRSRQLLHGLIR